MDKAIIYLSEAEALARLRAEIAKDGIQRAFAMARGVFPSDVNMSLNGTYNGGKGGISPAVLAAIGVRKETVYVLVKDAKERAA